MLVNDSDAMQRLNSPLNLLNRLQAASQASKQKSSMGLFIPSSQMDLEKINPFHSLKPAVSEPVQRGGSDGVRDDFNEEKHPSIDDLIENSDSTIKLATAHNKALEVLNSAINEISIKLPEIKADKLPDVVRTASKVVSDIRKERAEAQKARGNNSVHFHFYTPQQKQISDYEVIDVGAVASR
jgi:hypothetical protein